jgi:hypothetical protein
MDSGSKSRKSKTRTKSKILNLMRSKSKTRKTLEPITESAVLDAVIVNTATKLVTPIVGRRTWADFFRSIFTRKVKASKAGLSKWRHPPVVGSNAFQRTRLYKPSKLISERRMGKDYVAEVSGVNLYPKSKLNQTWKKVRGYNVRPGRSFSNWFGSKVRRAFTVKARPTNVPGFSELSKAARSRAINSRARSKRLEALSRTSVKYNRSKPTVSPGWVGSKMTPAARSKLGLSGGDFKHWFGSRQRVKGDPVNFKHGVRARRNNGSKHLGKGNSKTSPMVGRWKTIPKNATGEDIEYSMNLKEARESVPKSAWSNTAIRKNPVYASMLASIESRHEGPAGMIAEVKRSNMEKGVEHAMIYYIMKRYPPQNYPENY